MYMLKSAVTRAVKGATIAVVNDPAALHEFQTPDALWLVNRVVDGSFESESGIELIQNAAQAKDPPAMMLVSNHEDAQTQAMAAGALQGFGKAQLHAPATYEMIRQ